MTQLKISELIVVGRKTHTIKIINMIADSMHIKYKHVHTMNAYFVEECECSDALPFMIFIFPGPVSASEFDRMIAESMKDFDDEDVSDTEDPDLMVCLPKKSRHIENGCNYY